MISTPHFSQLSHSALLQCFEAFYYEILKQKNRAKSDTFNIANDNFDESAPQEHSKNFHHITIAEEIQTQLKLCMEEQAVIYAKRTGGIAPEAFKEIQYIMVALADEIFLNFPFRGARGWQLSLLEGQLFQTQIAGEQIFKRIDTLLNRQDITRYEIGQIYLMALSLGFKGQYCDGSGTDHINWYKEQLYQMICHESPTLYRSGQNVLMEQCYQSTIMGMPSKGLSDLKTWGKYAMILGGLYLVVSQFVWMYMTNGMYHDIQAILQITQSFKKGK